MKTRLQLDLAKIAPSIRFSASREIDRDYRWDGAGPDPAEDGFDACDVTVSALAVVNGDDVEGCAYLGGSYFEPREPMGDVHGYLNQMLEEAAMDLLKLLPDGQTKEECGAALAVIRMEMRAAYEAQRLSAS